MTRQEAKDLVNRIESLKVARKETVRIEFEGHEPEITLSEDVAMYNLCDQLEDAGWFVAEGILWDRDDTIAKRAAWNAAVKGWMASNPRKQMPSATVAKLQDECGVSVGALKDAIGFFEL